MNPTSPSAVLAPRSPLPRPQPGRTSRRARSLPRWQRARASLMGPSSGGRVSFVGDVSEGRTVTMLFTDVEGSTRLARELGDSWPEVVREHHRLVGGAIAEHGG